MPTTVIYEQDWATDLALTATYNEFQCHTPGDPNYQSAGVYAPFIYLGQYVIILDAGSSGWGYGVLEVDSGADGPGLVFWGLGADDPEGVVIPDDGTMAWDQRGVTYEFSWFWYNTFFNTGTPWKNGAYFPLFTVAKDLTYAPFTFAIYGAGNGANSKKLEVVRTLWGTGSSAVVLSATSIDTNDNVLHTFRVRAEPGTVTVLTSMDDDDGYTVASDGFIRIWMDDVLIYEETDIPLTFGDETVSGFNGNPVLLRSARLGYEFMAGHAGPWSIYREEPDPLTNITIFGENTTVKASNTFTVSLDGGTHEETEEGKAKFNAKGEFSETLQVGDVSGVTATALIGHGTDNALEAVTVGDGLTLIDNVLEATAGASAGAVVLLATLTASSSASLNFTTRNAAGQSGATFQSDFDHYRIEFIQVVPATDNVNLFFRTSTDGGSTWLSASSSYFYSGLTFTNAPASGNFNDGSFSSTYALIAGGIDTGSAAGLKGVYGQMQLWRPNSASEQHRYNGDTSTVNNSSQLERRFVDGFVTATTDIDAIQFLTTSGNLASGTIRVYGIY